jgi:hypothetical protein
VDQPKWDECIRAIRTQLKVAMDNLDALEATVSRALAVPEKLGAPPAPPEPKGPDLPMTKLQADYIRRLGVEPRPDLTRREASRLIERLKGSR